MKEPCSVAGIKAFTWASEGCGTSTTGKEY